MLPSQTKTIQTEAAPVGCVHEFLHVYVLLLTVASGDNVGRHSCWGFFYVVEES